MYLAFAPRFRDTGGGLPPDELRPYERFEIPRAHGAPLPATFYPTQSPARGAVLFIHPWLGWGRSYFHRHGRIEAVRAAGYHAMTFDLPGFGGTPRARRFYDIDIADAMSCVRERASRLALHLWGVSGGGVWAHAALSQGEGAFAGAFFEDVSPHLFEWSARMAPIWMPFYGLSRALFPDAYRFMDARAHAPHLKVRSAAYVSGAIDRGIRPDDTRELAALAGGEHIIVPGAGHLGAIKLQPQEVVGLALRTFARAEAKS
jgi:pimeloyl-ACP methyl ester carboxylesterase